MKKGLLLGSIITLSILLGGCAAQEQANQVLPPRPTPVVEKKVVAPVVKVEDPEVKAVTDELNNLDSGKDFPAYSAKDIQ
jgi:uncharacterized lipoprotein YajG